MPQAVIAKVNGACFTGGVELILACDIVIAAEEAVFADTHAILGLHPSLGLSQRLPRRVGMARAKELSFTARRFDGREAAAMGLALEAVPLAELDARVDVLAQAIAANSPGAVAAYKDLYRVSENTHLADGLDFETDAHYDVADAEARFADFVAKLSAKG
jgi:enoyl-CoA hydratase/carnithine racemase